jgi:hypothetical protein
VRYAAYEGGRVVLRGGFPFWGPVQCDPQRRAVTVPGAARLRYTSDGTYPVPIRPDWAVSRTAVTIDGDTLSIDDVGPGAAAAPLRVVPVVLREDGKEALGEVYEVHPNAMAAGGVRALAPLAAVEDLEQKE